MMKIMSFAMIAALATCTMADERARRSPGGAGWQSNGYNGGPSISAARSGWNTVSGKSFGSSSGWGSGSTGSGFGRSFGSSSGWRNSNSGFGGGSYNSWGGNGGYNNGYSGRSGASGWNSNSDWDSQGYGSGSNLQSTGWQASW